MAGIPSTRSSIQSSSSRGLQIGSSRSGVPFASYSGIQLNSSYDPVREAQRFAAQQRPERRPSHCLILGDTLPYLRRALAERFNQVRLISLYYHDQLPTAVAESFSEVQLDHAWWPSSESDLDSFLSSELAGVELSALLVVEWPPAARAFEDTARSIRESVRGHLRATAADSVTSAAFQRAWIDNLFANFLRIDRWHALRPHGRPTLIAASGPSLSRALPLIERHRHALFLVALPSSLSALHNRGIAPDLVVTVDAGYWARTHFESTPLTGAAVAMPLTAARGVWSQSVAPVLLSSESFLEHELFRLSGISPQSIQNTGTVSATALELAQQLTDSPIVFAGLDLAYDGLTEHVRPHTFDAVLELQSHRLRPLPSVTFERLLRLGLNRRPDGSTVTPAMSSYADWFRRLSPRGRTYRLFPSTTTLGGIETIEPDDLAALMPTESGAQTAPALYRLELPPADARASVLEKMLSRWEEKLSSTKRHLPAELIPLLEVLAPRDYLQQMHATQGSDQTRPADRTPVSVALAEIARLRDRFLS